MIAAAKKALAVRIAGVRAGTVTNVPCLCNYCRNGSHRLAGTLSLRFG